MGFEEIKQIYYTSLKKHNKANFKLAEKKRAKKFGEFYDINLRSTRKH